MDFSEKGQVSLSMGGYINDLLTIFSPTRGAKTPALNTLFEVSLTSAPLAKTAREEFHSVMMTLYYLAKRVRPDILTFCATKVLSPTFEDQSRLDRILGYVQPTCCNYQLLNEWCGFWETLLVGVCGTRVGRVS